MFERYPEYEYYLAFTQLAFAMLGMGASLAPRDFIQVFRWPRGLLIGLCTQLACVPLLAMGIAQFLGLEAGLTVGLILVAAVPGGSFSNVAVYLGRANFTLSIALTAASTLGCLITAPLILRIYSSEHLPPDFSMPTERIMFEITFCLLLPLAVGMLIGNRLTDERRRLFTRRCIQASLFFISLMIIGAAGSGRVEAGAFGWKAIGALLLLCAGGYGIGALLSRAAGLPAGDRVAVGTEAAIRNTNLALLIKASIFPAVVGVVDPFADQVLFMALLYGGIAIPVASLPLVAHARRTPRIP